MKIPFLNMFSRTPKPTIVDDGRKILAHTGRPRDTRLGIPLVEQDTLYAYPYLPVSYISLYRVSYMSHIVRNCIVTLKSEIFRRGLKIEPKFSAKCSVCKEEFHDTSPEQKCPKCGGELVPPDPKEKARLERIIQNVNANHQTLQEVLEKCDEDIRVADQGYIILRKEYILDPDGNIKYAKLKEIIPASPIVMRPVVHPATGKLGGRMLVCPIHRDQFYPYELDRHDENIPDRRCPKCGAKMLDVTHVALMHERGEIENRYIEGEVISWHEYGQNFTFSFPPMLTLWVLTTALIYKESYTRDAFMKQRVPKGAVVVSTSSPHNFLAFWDKVMENVRLDWNYIPVIPIEPEPGISGSASARINFVNFLGSMKDLDYAEIRREFMRAIAAFYGVSTVFLNEDSKGGMGGASAVAAKVLVSNRATERARNIYNTKVLSRIIKELGITNWKLEIAPSEDRDVLREQNIKQLELQIAQMFQTIGYRADYDKKTGTFTYKKDPIRELSDALTMAQMLLGMKGGGGYQSPYKVDENSKTFKTSKPRDGTTGEADPMEIVNPENPPSMKKGRIEGSEPISPDTGVGRKKNVTDGYADVKPTPPTSRTENAPGAIQSYTCPICGRQFETKQQLGGHMKSSHGVSAEGGDAQYSPEDYKYVIDSIINSGLFSRTTCNLLRDLLAKQVR